MGEVHISQSPLTQQWGKLHPLPALQRYWPEGTIIGQDGCLNAALWNTSAMIMKKEEGTMGGVKVIYPTLNDNTASLDSNLLTSLFPLKENLDALYTPTKGHEMQYFSWNRSMEHYSDIDPFEVVLIVDPEALKSAYHDYIKLQNLPRSSQLSREDPEARVTPSPSTHQDDNIIGEVNDVIGLTHLHKPAIPHLLWL
eukprot:13817627-Ditylum_brightwellii.AAC.1